MNWLYALFGKILYWVFLLVNNYGIAIILFTCLIKTAILPLNIKQTSSMKRMQMIQPELMNLQKKYQNNPEKLNEEMAKLYKAYQVNPMSGCLPLLIQLPVIWGLFGALRDPAQWVFTNGDLSPINQKFLWLTNLGSPDPYYILPILVVVITFISQKYTMDQQQSGDAAMQSSQKVMLLIMPLMVGWFAISMPAGVSLYWVVQSLYTFVQQFFTMRKPVEKISVAEAEHLLQEREEEKKKKEKAARKEQAKLRQDMMNAQMGKPKKDKKKVRPKTKPASTKRRKTITKIPQSDERTKTKDK